MKDCDRTPTRGKSVRHDWHAWLPEAKAKVFDFQVQRLESRYIMLSVSLNEALELRHLGYSTKSLQALSVTSGLCKLLTQPLAGLLRALYDHAKHYGIVPNAAPLDPSNFMGLHGQRSARVNSLLNHVLLSQRLQFLHKISTLGEIIEDLAKEYRQAVNDLADGVSSDPGKTWAAVDSDHYDLNTCLREAIVVFKSFLIALPEGQLAPFQKAVRTQSVPLEVGAASRIEANRHRRMTSIAGRII